MICPLCASPLVRVYDHCREQNEREPDTLARRRECRTCGARWATVETFVRLVRDSTDALGTGERYRDRQRNDQ